MATLTESNAIWSAERWCAYFRRQQFSRLVLSWHRGPELTGEEHTLIASSVQEFQQGEGLEGHYFFRCVAEYAQRTGDWKYQEAHRLFMAEEKQHARDLARFMTLAGIPLLTKRSLLNKAFCWLGSRGRLEMTLAIILMVEVIAQTYYSALRYATRSPPLRRLCDQILRDEKSHVRFQAEQLGRLRRQRSSFGRGLDWALDLVFILGAGMACWCGHAHVLRAGGFGWRRYWRVANRYRRRGMTPVVLW